MSRMTKRRAPKEPTAAQKAIRAGTRVKVTLDGGDTVETKTVCDPWRMGGYTWVVLLKNISGVYALYRVSRLDEQKERPG